MSVYNPLPSTVLAHSTTRRRRGVLQLTVRIVGGVALLVFCALLTVFVIAERRARAHVAVPMHTVTVSSDQATIARGARLSRVRFCSDCHGEGLTGRVMVESPAIGRIAPPNLTSGRRPQPLTDQDWERAVRHGVRADGSVLRIMPSHEFADVTDDDLAAIIAYARSLPAARWSPPPTDVGPVLKALDVAGQVNLYPATIIDHAKPHRARLSAEPTASYGRYVASTCTGCHGPGLSGGKIPGAPPEWPAAANITPSGIGHYSLADLTRVLRTGVRPDGSRVNDIMPWKFTRSLDDTEIAAIYAYLKSVPPREYGLR